MQLPLVPYYETCDEDGPCAPYFTGHITDADGRVMCRTDSEERAIELVDCVDGLSANIEALRARLAEVEKENEKLTYNMGVFVKAYRATKKRLAEVEAQKTALAEALREIETLYWHDAPCPQDMRDIAREALAKLEEPR